MSDDDDMPPLVDGEDEPDVPEHEDTQEELTQGQKDFLEAKNIPLVQGTLDALSADELQRFQVLKRRQIGTTLAGQAFKKSELVEEVYFRARR